MTTIKAKRLSRWLLMSCTHRFRHMGRFLRHEPSAREYTIAHSCRWTYMIVVQTRKCQHLLRHGFRTWVAQWLDNDGMDQCNCIVIDRFDCHFCEKYYWIRYHLHSLVWYMVVHPLLFYHLNPRYHDHDPRMLFRPEKQCQIQHLKIPQ